MHSHHQRDMAESFGADAERYDRARPDYPGELVAAIVAATPGLDVVDVGIGTGIAARQFRAAGCRVLGVEPDPRMAELARRDGFPVEVSSFEEWDPAGRLFDAVIAAQAWHWIDPAAGAVKAGRALRPGGRLAVFWNMALPPPGLAEEFAAGLRSAVPGLPPALTEASRDADPYGPTRAAAAEGIRAAAVFDEPEERRFDSERPYTRDEWLETLSTSGLHARLTPAQRAEVAASTAAAIDAVGGRFTARFVTVAVTAARAGAA
ncbi:methyltransferase type 11 [Sphaerisporangium rufum]|uniref:Methyltransferase type 11 n=2 Tax=Sphaerisporangium rufum TaxID=1381558 RepID=A0A919R4B4_9ACTN|nr:methyltransferase type 11 [Sphaerisporangium rufum]